MTNLIKGSWGAVQNFWSNEEGIGTLEMILIVAVIVTLALLFKTSITTIVTNTIKYMETKSAEFTK
ncbi:Flp1 family type IVb pilin [Paenibacillus kyungheensis]